MKITADMSAAAMKVAGLILLRYDFIGATDMYGHHTSFPLKSFLIGFEIFF